MNPIAVQLAVQETRYHALSALPDAPTVPDPPHRRTPATRPRRAVAGGLRWAANRIEPGVA